MLLWPEVILRYHHHGCVSVYLSVGRALPHICMYIGCVWCISTVNVCTHAGRHVCVWYSNTIRRPLTQKPPEPNEFFSLFFHMIRIHNQQIAWFRYVVQSAGWNGLLLLEQQNYKRIFCFFFSFFQFHSHSIPLIRKKHIKLIRAKHNNKCSFWVFGFKKGANRTENKNTRVYSFTSLDT